MTRVTTRQEYTPTATPLTRGRSTWETGNLGNLNNPSNRDGSRLGTCLIVALLVLAAVGLVWLTRPGPESACQAARVYREDVAAGRVPLATDWPAFRDDGALRADQLARADADVQRACP